MPIMGLLNKITCLIAKELKMTLFDDIYGRTFPFAIGFDRTFQLLERAATTHPSVTYPPYNIVKEDDENFSIELAVAGFDKKDISVSKEKENLIIEGKSDEELTRDELKILQKYVGKPNWLVEEIVMLANEKNMDVFPIYWE